MPIFGRKITVDIRIAANSSSVRAYADVTLTFADGEIQLIGFAIIEHPGKDPFVAFPQNRGRNRYFPVVQADGDLRKELISEILRAYEHERERK